MTPAKFYVYRNLHKGGFSVKQRGKVVLRPERFYLVNPELRVSEASQSRARRNQQRNVHAFVVGEAVGIPDGGRKPFTPTGQLYYNPFKYDTFVDFKTRKPIESVSGVYFDGDGAYYK